jgi:hypothetical protein
MNKTCHNCGVEANVYLPSRCIDCHMMGFSRRELWYPRHTIPVDQPERVLVVSGEGRIITGAEGRVESKGRLRQSDNSAHSR